MSDLTFLRNETPPFIGKTGIVGVFGDLSAHLFIGDKLITFRTGAACSLAEELDSLAAAPYAIVEHNGRLQGCNPACIGPWDAGRSGIGGLFPVVRGRSAARRDAVVIGSLMTCGPSSGWPLSVQCFREVRRLSRCSIA